MLRGALAQYLHVLFEQKSTSLYISRGKGDNYFSPNTAQ